MLKKGAYFVTGIGTDVGKTYATGWLAKNLASQGHNVTTQKLIQTGCKEYSDDIKVHRDIMGVELTPFDIDHTTAPLILSYPASPHLAARIDGRDIDYNIAAESTEKLLKHYETVLIEGAGGLMVPLTEDYFTIDYIADHKLPTIVVTNGYLGSISHTVLAVEALKARNIPVAAVLYNPHFDSTDEIVSAESREWLRRWLARTSPDTEYIVMD